MAVAVFDADVLIAYLNRDDAHHAKAVDRVRKALEPGTRRLVSAVTYAEVLIGPVEAAGAAGAGIVDAMVARLTIETVQVDTELARQAAVVRARTKLRIPDAFTLATAMHAESRGHGDVRIESFDRKLNRAFADLHR